MAIKRNYDKGYSELVCNTCSEIIVVAYGAPVHAQMQLEVKGYEGTNGYPEHECTKCRQKRERGYDAWATSPR